MSHKLLHAWIQDLIQGGGVQARQPENSLDRFLFLFFSPQLILQFTEGIQWFITEKTILSQDPEGVQYFPGGSNFFHGGSEC